MSGDYFEAAETLFSVAEFLTDIDSVKANKLYEQSIYIWEKQIDAIKLQGQFHEIAEIYLRISDIYRLKFNDKKLEKKYILYSIKYLKQESELLKEFSETRKLTQNIQNIAELYLKVSDFKKAVRYYKEVIKISKLCSYYDLLSYSLQRKAYCYEELDNYNKAKETALDGVEFFISLYQGLEEKNDNLAIAQISQILKTLYKLLSDRDQYINYCKKEASAYIKLAEGLEKKENNFLKIARYYRGAGLCYREIQTNILDSASCFVLAGNYSEKIGEYQESAVNFFDAANAFKKLSNVEMTYKHYIKAGDMFGKTDDVNQSTECYLNAYDIAVEGELDFNRFGIFNQIIRGLHQIARNGLKNKQFYTAATLILESIKFYEQLDIARDFLLRKMVRNVYKYYYRAANLKKIGFSHIVHSYVLAAISCIFIGQLDKAWKIASEIESKGKTVNNYKKIIEQIILWVAENKEVELENFPYTLRRLIESSEDIMYLLNLYKRL